MIPLAALILVSPPIHIAHTSSLAVLHATVIDGAGAPAIKNATVLIRDGRFVAVGPSDKVRVPSRAKIVDGTGRWLIPGLIDMHVHLDEVITPGAFELFGVTSVRDMGSSPPFIQALRARERRGEALPRIFWLGQNIDEKTKSWWGAVAVKGPAEVPALLDRMRRQGADGFKLYVNAGPDVTRSVIVEGHRRGMPVSAHLGKTKPSDAARDGIDNLEHVTTLMQELKTVPPRPVAGYLGTFFGVPDVDINGAKAHALIDAIVRRKVAITATLTVAMLPVDGIAGAKQNYGEWCGVPDGWRRYWADPYWSFIGEKGWTGADFDTAHRARPVFLALVRRLHDAGAKIIAGTDTPAPWVLPGAGLLVELDLLTQAGLRPSEALQAATGRAAIVLRKDRDIGTVRVGRRADFVLLDANPLVDIRNTRRIRAVYKDGKLVDRATLRRNFERADRRTVKLHE